MAHQNPYIVQITVQPGTTIQVGVVQTPQTDTIKPDPVSQPSPTSEGFHIVGQTPPIDKDSKVPFLDDKIDKKVIGDTYVNATWIDGVLWPRAHNTFYQVQSRTKGKLHFERSCSYLNTCTDVDHIETVSWPKDTPRTKQLFCKRCCVSALF